MKIYFVRHGKTEWNLEGRFQGYSGDSALLPESYQDLEKLGKYLAEIPFDAIYSSDLQRAHSTAVEIAKANHHCQTVLTTPQLREWNFGTLEGSKMAIFRAIYPKQAWALKHNLARFKHDVFDAESVHQVTQRMVDFIQSLQEENLETVLIVSHGALLTASIHRLLGFPPAQLRHRGGLDNASVTILETSDFENFTELAWNDTSYNAKQ
ncbi:TPA: histidine phosphatase family protein [Streptococcus suis]|uniref:histidine phosphatase family protein n=1 Tax=Streptococcus suis TaxID=1307 RepID=UPI001960DFAC|nr:histidine phosphatase family protein [Streptococcus suis]MBM7138312.1 histidine phosphatase family protein [Streptococcus suis]MBY4601329.1 histidine phosphatase family protein [Streptococcus suis]MCO8172894.1 histidine phosphatase family protein [Streptococcus suis]MCO8181278.1 histidine phosphatase family protein [Streptococcus suis]MCO8191413.1 histidine phosphatase family protein [Streptococcus suis]